MYYVYLLESETSGRYYIGHTQDITDRLMYHNTGRSVFTRGRGPWRMLAYRTFSTRSAAMKAEYKLKKMKDRKLIQEYFRIEA